MGRRTDVLVLRLEKGDPWVYGVLVNKVWSTGGGSPSYNKLPGRDIPVVRPDDGPNWQLRRRCSSCAPSSLREISK